MEPSRFELVINAETATMLGVMFCPFALILIGIKAELKSCVPL